MKRFYIYAVGGILLGIFYWELKEWISNGPLFLLFVFAYTVILRWLAEYFGRR